MRALVSHMAAVWAASRERRQIAMLEREQNYHRGLLYFHAERAFRIHHALIRLRRSASERALGAHAPSVSQLDGSRR